MRISERDRSYTYRYLKLAEPERGQMVESNKRPGTAPVQRLFAPPRRDTTPPSASEIYTQQSEHRRQLAVSLNQRLVMFITIVGGTWYLASQAIAHDRVVAGFLFLADVPAIFFVWKLYSRANELLVIQRTHIADRFEGPLYRVVAGAHAPGHRAVEGVVGLFIWAGMISLCAGLYLFVVPASSHPTPQKTRVICPARCELQIVASSPS